MVCVRKSKEASVAGKEEVTSEKSGGDSICAGSYNLGKDLRL